MCVEYRSRGGGATGCNEVAVYLDGVPVSAPGRLYSTMTLENVDRVEVLSPLEAMTRYGNRASGGALLIGSRNADFGDPTRASRLPVGFDWSLEQEPYPWARVLGSSCLGNAVGVGLGYLMINRCMHVERTEFALSFKANCGRLYVLGTGLLSVGLPAVGGGTAAGWAGSTNISRGRFLPSAFVGVVSSTAGYLLLLRAETQDNRTSEIAGAVILSVGTPLLMTMSDRLFRSLR